ncbi:hypothetical protein [Nocardioides sp.]|uniref:hypothetical protein n=1 Tax=Nocardioides sp. TaxID=35761 RepID=UPI002735EDBB|nr:hypothetical protein [Nocardioides sp.]MDP3890202.1 hypothetical protein [Nocardioides sp.]
MYPALTLAVALYLGVVAVLALAGLLLPQVEQVARLAMRIGQYATMVVVLLDAITLLQGHEPPQRSTHIGYGVAAIGLPVILLSRRPEQEGEEAPQPHLAVIAVVAAAMVVMVIRLQQTWS